MVSNIKEEYKNELKLIENQIKDINSKLLEWYIA